MNGKTLKWTLFLSLTLLIAALLAGCGQGETATNPSDTTPRETFDTVMMPEHPGKSKTSSPDGTSLLDYSNVKDGYVMIKYTGDADKVQIQVTNPDGSVYPYPLEPGDYRAFPLTGGSGSYQIALLEHISGNNYAMGLSQSMDVKIKESNRPYLYPSQYVKYNKDSESVKLCRELSAKSMNDLDLVKYVYKYVIKHVTYDHDLAANLPVNYIPDADSTLKSKKGICFDYASLMTAMLRSQHIPTRLEVGYAGTIYHAWISVWTEETGWVDNIIQFDGDDWTLMDPTMASANGGDTGDDADYQVKYHY